MTTSGGTRAATAATSRRVKQKLVNLLFGKEFSRTGPEGHRKLDYSMYKYDDLKKAYLERLHVLHPDKQRNIQRDITYSQSKAERNTKHEFQQLQEIWSQYDEMAKSMMKVAGGDGENANFTQFGVGCSFSDSEAERALRSHITDQACRGWFSSGLLAEQGQSGNTDPSQKATCRSYKVISLIDDDLFIETTEHSRETGGRADVGRRPVKTSPRTLIPGNR
ncbi:hypothetical protein IV203_005921 [Nitzschia inconspicua]|uniref:J domain-containing protein n=1 Tax=Nitzschia inconspicua TaxID=303405 RepID=A0A9K3KNK0_9STRA|nr:hypothetical protein IV203_005921 [Nitzschia inconspicua]